MVSEARPVGLALAVARSLASCCLRSAVVWAVWARRDGAAMRARDRMMLRGILAPCGWSDCNWVGLRRGERGHPSGFGWVRKAVRAFARMPISQNRDMGHPVLWLQPDVGDPDN